jgi:hypothetical protein
MLAHLADHPRRVLEQLSLAWPCTYRLMKAGKKYFHGKEHSERCIFHVNRRDQRNEQAMYIAFRHLDAHRFRDVLFRLAKFGVAFLSFQKVEAVPSQPAVTEGTSKCPGRRSGSGEPPPALDYSCSYTMRIAL